MIAAPHLILCTARRGFEFTGGIAVVAGGAFVSGPGDVTVAVLSLLSAGRSGSSVAFSFDPPLGEIVCCACDACRERSSFTTCEMPIGIAAIDTAAYVK